MSEAILPDEFEMEKGADGKVRIVAKQHVLSDGSVVVIMDDGKRLTDEGETESNLYIRGIGDFRNRMHALNRILKKHGAKYDRGEIYVEYGDDAQENDYVDALKRLCKAILEVERKIPAVIIDDEYIEQHTRTVYIYMCKNNHNIRHHTKAEFVICPFCGEKTSEIVSTETTSPEPYTYSEIIELLHNVREWLLEKWEFGKFHNPDRMFENIGNLSQWRYRDMLEFVKMMADGLFTLPDRYMQLLTHDAGYIFLWGVFAGSKEFYVCEDCGALHPAEYYVGADIEVGGYCEICGDNRIAFVVRIDGTEIREVERR